MPTYTLNGISLAAGGVFQGTTQLVLTFPEDSTFIYEYSNSTNNPGFASEDFAGAAATPIPEALLDEFNNTSFNVGPYGDDPLDELYFAELNYFNGSTNESLVGFVVYDASTDLSHFFILSSTDPNVQIPQNGAQFAAFFGSVTSVTQVTSGPFAPGVNIDPSLVFPATLDSINQNDNWTGTDLGEGFNGGIGNDTLDGAGGEDILVGGAGNDSLIGGADIDAVVYSFEDGPNGVTVNLGTGIAIDSYGDTDTLSGIEQVGGTPQADSLTGDANDNDFAGGDGADTIDGAGGFDAVDYEFLSVGGVNVDLGNQTATDSFGEIDVLISIEEVIGSNFNDTILGDGENNSLVGQAGNDHLMGAGGNDYFDPSSNGTGFESDTVDGGEGDDRVAVFDDIGNFSIAAEENGTTTIHNGVDTVIMTNVETIEFSDATIDLATGTAGNDTLTNTTGNAILLFGLAGDDSLTGAGGNDTLFGGDNDDTLVDGAGNDEVYGGAGNDYIRNTTGSDLYDGGDGFDTMFVDVSGAVNTFTIEVNLITEYSGILGNPTLSDTIRNIEALEYIGHLDASVTGDGNANLFMTDSGNDTLLGGGGNDTLESGSGNDSVDGGLGDDYIDAGSGGTDTVDGGDGTDTVRIDGLAAAFTITTASGTTTVTDGSTTLILSNVEALEFNDGVTSLDNTFIGSAAPEQIDGTEEDDFIDGLEGNDSLYGLGGNDTIFGSQNNDYIEGGDGDDELRGNLNGDTIYGDAGFDRIYGNLGFDSLYGGGQADSIYGGNQNDVIYGDLGNDLVSGQGDNDTVYGGDGFDVVLGGPGDDVLYGGNQADTMYGGQGFDTLYGEGGSDRMFGTADANVMDGGAGFDWIYGFDGDDILHGGADNDRLFGGADNDTMDGGTGDDTIFGSTGADLFVFEANHGNDVIRDFDANGELIDLTALGTNIGALTIASVAGGTLVTTPDGTILLEGVAVGDVTGADFLF